MELDVWLVTGKNRSCTDSGGVRTPTEPGN
jgi:hypothetical protein